MEAGAIFPGISISQFKIVIPLFQIHWINKHMSKLWQVLKEENNQKIPNSFCWNRIKFYKVTLYKCSSHKINSFNVQLMKLRISSMSVSGNSSLSKIQQVWSQFLWACLTKMHGQEQSKQYSIKELLWPMEPTTMLNHVSGGKWRMRSGWHGWGVVDRREEMIRNTEIIVQKVSKIQGYKLHANRWELFLAWSSA